MKYGLRSFLRDFGTTDQCLDHLRAQRWPDGIDCEACEGVTNHYRVTGRKCYACQDCGRHVYPAKGTILERTKVPLPDWFYCILVLSQTRAGISAKQIERDLEVSYPTALRMCNLIRSQLGQQTSAMLAGEVECDEVYIGGKARYRGQYKPGRPSEDAKQAVFGVVERGGTVRPYLVPNVKRETVLPLIQANVAEGATLYTDEYGVYRTLSRHGYEHAVVRHKAKEYAREEVNEETGEVRNVHTNSMEGFWSYPKSAILRIHRGVSRKHMQGYFDEHAFRYNHRNEERPIFHAMLNRVASPRAAAPPA